MDNEKFLELLKLLGKEKKGEEEKETIPKSQAKIGKHLRKTFYEIFMEDRDGK